MISSILAILGPAIKLINTILGWFKKSTTEKIENAKSDRMKEINDQIERARNRK